LEDRLVDRVMHRVGGPGWKPGLQPHEVRLRGLHPPHRCGSATSSRPRVPNRGLPPVTTPGSTVLAAALDSDKPPRFRGRSPRRRTLCCC